MQNRIHGVSIQSWISGIDTLDVERLEQLEDAADDEEVEVGELAHGLVCFGVDFALADDEAVFSEDVRRSCVSR